MAIGKGLPIKSFVLSNKQVTGILNNGSYPVFLQNSCQFVTKKQKFSFVAESVHEKSCLVITLQTKEKKL